MHFTKYWWPYLFYSYLFNLFIILENQNISCIISETQYHSHFLFCPPFGQTWRTADKVNNTLVFLFLDNVVFLIICFIWNLKPILFYGWPTQLKTTFTNGSECPKIHKIYCRLSTFPFTCIDSKALAKESSQTRHCIENVASNCHIHYSVLPNISHVWI